MLLTSTRDSFSKKCVGEAQPKITQVRIPQLRVVGSNSKCLIFSTGTTTGKYDRNHISMIEIIWKWCGRQVLFIAVFPKFEQVVRSVFYAWE